MEYILFAFLALVFSSGNTIFNRLGSNHASALINATIKSFYIIFACFIMVVTNGHLVNLYSLSPTKWLWIILMGVLTSIDWFFYFLAIKDAHLEAFAPLTTSSILFLSNSLFLIFTFNMVTNGGKSLNIIFYIIGLLALLGAMLFIVFNKKINPKAKWKWVIYTFVSVLAFAFVLLIAKTKLSDIDSSIISFHQMSIVFISMFITSLFTKKIKEVVTIRKIDHLYIFIGAVFNAFMIMARYQAFSYENAVPAIVNVIVGLDFVIVSIATIIFFKAKNKLPLTIVIILVVAGMIFDTLAGLI